MYGEDLDWAFRIKQAGWKVWYNPTVTVLHYKEAASQHSDKARYEFYGAMAIFYRKHYAAQTSWPLHFLILGGISVARRAGDDQSQAKSLAAAPPQTNHRLGAS